VPEPLYKVGVWQGERDCAKYAGLEVEKKSCCGGKLVRQFFYVRCSLHGNRIPASVMCRRDLCRSYLRAPA
jgi:hypothetical protein